jgi:HAMP domain-containing protein
LRGVGAREGLDQEASAEIRTIVGSEAEIRSAWVLVCAVEGDCSPRDLIAVKPNTDPELTRSVLEAFNKGGRKARITLESGDLLVADEVAPRTGVGRGHVIVVLDTIRIRQAISSLRQILLIALLVSVAVFIALVGVLSRVLLIAPIRQMRAQAARLSEADLSGRVEGATTRELQELADALNMIGQGLRDTIGRVRGVAESVAQVIDQISRSASTTSGGSATVLTRVEETSSAMVEMLASLKGIAENVAAIKVHTRVPVAVGFGISTPDQAAEVGRAADGVVVGSAIVRIIERHGAEADVAAKVEAFVKPLVDAAKSV